MAANDHLAMTEEEPTVEPDTDLDRQMKLARGGHNLLRDEHYTI
jgi:hypothetical protein